MAKETGISWATSTFNPWIGCTKVGPGCDHCYAEARMDTRLHIVNWGAGAPRKRTSIANWRGPVKWNAERERAIAAGENPPPHRVFCSSLADVFDNEVDPQWRADLFALIRDTPNLIWLLLTKRIGNAANMIDEALQHDGAASFCWPWPNVWFGATVVNQEEADRDIPKLLAVPAAKRFLSIEPMLGAIDLTWVKSKYDSLDDQHSDVLSGYLVRHNISGHIPSMGNPRLDWVIAGGESGPGARPMHPDWARSLRDQCAAAGVPFLFKQWGEWAPDEHFTYLPNRDENIHEWLESDNETIIDHSWRYGTKATGNTLDGRQHLEFPV